MVVVRVVPGVVVSVPGDLEVTVVLVEVKHMCFHKGTSPLMRHSKSTMLRIASINE